MWPVVQKCLTWSARRQNLFVNSIKLDAGGTVPTLYGSPHISADSSNVVSGIGGQVRRFASLTPARGNTRALLIANSTLYGGSYMGHCGETIQKFLKKGDVSEVLFVPYALKDYEKYFGNPRVIKYDASGQPIDHTGRPKARLQELGIASKSIHHAEDPVAAVKAAKALFIGGGNTFRLLKKLHEQNLVDLIRERVNGGDMLYIGSSCGSTVAGATIHTTICMPIMEIPSFKGLGLVPFNISPHYADPEPKAKLHELGFTVSMEENREQRIRQYTDELDDALPTVAIREGTCVEVDGSHATLHGGRPCRVFVPKQAPKDYPPGSNLDFILK